MGHRGVGLFPDRHGTRDDVRSRSPPASARGFLWSAHHAASRPRSRHAIEDRQGGQSVGLQPQARGGKGGTSIVAGRPRAGWTE